MQTNYTVYIHVAPNGKKYVGITGQSVEQRWRIDGHGYKPQKLFYRAILKYGWENFEHIIIAENLSSAEAGKLEQELIEKYNTCNSRYGYNVSTGGENSPIGCKRSDETRKKLSESHKGQRSWNAGKHLSESTKEKLRQANIGKYLSEKTKAKISAKNKGYKPSSLAISRAIEKCSKAVIQLSTGKEFSSAAEAEKYSGEHRNTITRHCRGEVGEARWAFKK